MRTTLTIDDDVLSVTRALAQRKKTSLGSAVSEVARRGFEGEVSLADDNGRPVFAVPPDAKPITNEDVHQALKDWP